MPILPQLLQGISIHAPRTGSDDHGIIYGYERVISIHAPRTGSDALQDVLNARLGDFNPRSPHGERQVGRKSD